MLEIKNLHATVDGKDILTLNERPRTLFRRAHIGFIYQFFHLIPTLTVRENIELVLELNNWMPSVTKQRVDWLLQKTGLAHRSMAFPDQLSGGEQQRVAIARAIAHKPALILADEPTGNLDSVTGAQVLSLLNDLVRNQGSSSILVTHSLTVAKTADRIITLEKGKLVAREGEFAW